jgi:hypothetical protein
VEESRKSAFKSGDFLSSADKRFRKIRDIVENKESMSVAIVRGGESFR